MHARRITSFVAALAFFASMMPTTPVFAVSAASPFIEREFTEPIDGFSVRLPDDAAAFRYQFRSTNTWSSWSSYESDGDVGPGEESELLIVPRGTQALRITDIRSASDIHPITVSHEPLKVRTASLVAVAGMPAILSRAEWGADEDHLYATTDSNEPSVAESTEKGDNGTPAVQVNQRVTDCQNAQKGYPEEFKYAKTVLADPQGNKFLWPIQYSKNVKLLVVHHTALLVEGDPRSSVERVRALYKYHAVNKKWGDIGYNYVIDEAGRIYEGRQGGKYAVGGHAYCNNTGTVGIVLMGNFELEKPSQEQAKSLQWLLKDLSSQYGINLGKSVQFHGKTFASPIVGHKDLLSTACPGYAVANALPQIRTNVMENRTDAGVVFTLPPRASTSSSAPSMIPVTVQTNDQFAKVGEGIAFLGRTSIAINPGGKQRLSFAYTAGPGGAYEGKKVAEVKLSHPDINLWVDDGVHQVQVRTGILLPYDLPAGEQLTFQLIVQAPVNTGLYTFYVGGLKFDMSVYGRRARTGEYTNPFTGNQLLIVDPPERKKDATLTSKVRSYSRPSQQSSSAASVSSVSSSAASRPAVSVTSPSPSPSASTPIRVRLSADPGVTVTFTDSGMLSDLPVRGGTTFTLLLKSGECEANYRGQRFTSGPVLRLRSDVSGTLSVQGVKKYNRTYQGVLECRVVDGALALINELPLEQYMAGIAEEPDTEPYQKQRAFAIAARTYAAYYMQEGSRKFPGKPYDGSDDPAVFQAYAGIGYAANNPEWIRAVKSTENQVLFYNNALLRPPYFSSDDGRTRSPTEAGWASFPNAEVFASKPDPWCKGMTLRGHGVGMSGCGALGQAKEGRSAEQILQYYYPGARISER